MSTRKIFTAKFILLGICIWMGIHTANAQTSNERPFIDVRATSTQKVTPDELYLSITIDENTHKGKKTLEEMQFRMLDIMKYCGIDVENCLKVDDMGSQVKVKRFSSKIKTRTSAHYTLKLTDIATMQKLIEKLEKIEISQISLLQTGYSKKEELERSLSIEAVKKAKAKATDLAEALGQKVGKAIYIYAQPLSQPYQPRLYKRQAVAFEAESAAPYDANMAQGPQLMPGEQEYTVTVNVKFELQ